MSQLQQLWKTCVFYAEQLATTLINGVQAFVQHLLNWLMTNQSPLMKMAFAAILINVIPNGSSLTPLIMTNFDDMIGFSLEFKRWYVVVRGPKGTVYTAFGFAKQMPVFTPAKTMSLQEYIDDYNDAIVFTDEEGEELMRI
jgi:hypothetical protein